MNLISILCLWQNASTLDICFKNNVDKVSNKLVRDRRKSTRKYFDIVILSSTIINYCERIIIMIMSPELSR